MALQRQAPERDADHEIARLASETGLTVAAAVLGPLGPTVIRLAESTQPVHVSLRVGTVLSLLHTAIGRVFAAYLGEEPLRDMLALEALRLAGSAPGSAVDAQRTKKPPADMLGSPDRLLLERIRRERIDAALGAPIPGIDALAAPVFDHTGAVRLVLALIGSTGSFESGFEGMPARRLVRATRQLSWRLGWAPVAKIAA
jgi:DNA-binding IclR family transcriptional regulator